MTRNIVITQAQAEVWAGRSLTDEEMVALEVVLPFSSVPEAISAIVDGFPE